MLGGAFLVANRQTVFPGVHVQGENVSGLTVAQTTAKLRQAGWTDPNAVAITVTLPADRTMTVSAGTSGWTTDARTAAEAAWNYGRDGNLFSNFFRYLGGALFGHDAGKALHVPVYEEALRAKVDDQVQIANQIMSGGNLQYDLENQVVRLTKGGELLLADADTVYQQILDALEAYERTLDCVPKPAAEAEAKEMDLQQLHDQICGAPVNAYYDNESGEIIEAKPGVEFDVTEAQRLWDEAMPGEEVEIPAVITDAAFHKADVPGLYCDLLAYKSTSLSGSSYNRVNNVSLAASKINDIVLYPGDSLSYNETLGQRTMEAGFLEAGAYSEGQVVQEVGGGICQVSSTLYWCAMKANLHILERTNHYFSVGYIEPGMDATVSWGAPDFRFENNRTFPIVIHAYVQNGQLTVEIWGTDVDHSYVNLEYVQKDMVTITYRHVFDWEGNELSNEVEAVSTYHTHKAE